MGSDDDETGSGEMLKLDVRMESTLETRLPKPI